MCIPQFRRGSTDIMITHNLKNVGYLINIFISLLFTEMVVPVMLDILQILTGFRCEFNGFHRKPSRQLSLFSETHFFPTTQVHRCSSLLPVNPAGHLDTWLCLFLSKETKWLADYLTLCTIITWFYERFYVLPEFISESNCHCSGHIKPRDCKFKFYMQFIRYTKVLPVQNIWENWGNAWNRQIRRKTLQITLYDNWRCLMPYS